jgi:Protein of unknown function (DUF2934)
MLGTRSSPDAVRERAFQLYEERGRGHGNDLQDWFGAEYQVFSR